MLIYFNLLFPSFQIEIKINGGNFDGSTTLLETNRRLRSLAGNISWFTEFQPIPCLERDIFELLLLRLFQLNICCHLSGSFATCNAGVFHSYRAATLYVAMTDIPFVNLLFQKGPIEIEHFGLDEFWFSFSERRAPSGCLLLLHFKRCLQHKVNRVRNWYISSLHPIL